MPEEHPPVRFRGTVHYDGAAFHGFQIQPDARSVQEGIERVLSRLLDRPTRIHAAGRTDTGVHAAGQEIAFDAPSRWGPGELHRALNAVAPDEIWFEKLRPAGPDFHPRFDATGRRYEYLVGTAADAASPLRAGRIWALARPVDEERLAAATGSLPGERRFDAFAKSGQPERGVRCRVEEATWRRTAAGDLAFRIVADRFLHRMVRYLVHTLIEVGTGRRGPDEVAALLAGSAESRPPRPAPACGLYLTGVRYADGWNRPAGIPGVRAGADTGADPEAHAGAYADSRSEAGAEGTRATEGEAAAALGGNGNANEDGDRPT